MSFFNKKTVQQQVNTNNSNKNKEVVQKSYKSSTSSSSTTTTSTVKEYRTFSSSSSSTSSSFLQTNNGITKSNTLPSIRYEPVYQPVASSPFHSTLKPFGSNTNIDASPFSQTRPMSKPLPSRTTAREAFLNAPEVPLPSYNKSVFTPTKPYTLGTNTEKPKTIFSVPAKAAKSILEAEPERYTLNGKEEGYVVIFNHEHFADETMERRGTKNDEKELKHIFETFKFRITIHRDLKLKQIKDEISYLRTKKNFKNNSCLVIIVLSHGDENETISAFDGHYTLQTTMVEEIIKNDTLLGKPKIFIINSCKGSIEPQKAKVLQQDSVPYRSKIYEKSIARETEILKIYSTFEKRVSYRDEDKGSIFIQTLCIKLKEKGFHTPIDDILREVRKEISERLNQTPTETSSMTKKFCFGDALKKK